MQFISEFLNLPYNSGRIEMKACESCGPVHEEAVRVQIGKHHRQQSFSRRFFGVWLIYLPVITLPFVLFSAYLSYWHLRMMGAKNVKLLSAFLPTRKSYRYTMKSQITMQPGYALSPTQSRLFWIFNCTWYCPISVGLFEWHAYLVKLVENWWCPFRHDMKENHYSEAKIDQSFWHIYPEDIGKLEPEDRDNPIWNENSEALVESGKISDKQH
jgi:hypothetical protein